MKLKEPKPENIWLRQNVEMNFIFGEDSIISQLLDGSIIIEPKSLNSEVCDYYVPLKSASMINRKWKISIEEIKEESIS